MTTYSGKGASYVAGKEVVNKEPPVSKYVVEKLYRVHRERVLNVQPTIDSHVKIPDFLTNQAWKKNAERQKMVSIMRTNRALYDRLAKVETSESLLTKENKDHIRRMESKLSYLTKLKEHGRLVNLIKIQKENEYMLRRIEKAKPQYTMKKCKEWYKHHELYKQGRRSDPTGGHIMHGMHGLLPPVIPRNGSSVSSRESLDQAIKSSSRMVLPSMSTMSAGGSSSLRSGSDSKMVPGSFSSSEAASAAGGSGNSYAIRRINRAQMAGFYDRKPLIEEVDSDDDEAKEMMAMMLAEQQAPAELSSAAESTSPHVHSMAQSRAPFMEYTEEGGSDDGSHHSATELENKEQEEPNEAHDDLMLLSSRPFAIPFDSKNCLVQVYSSRSYDENIYLKVVTAGLSSKTVAERSLTIDKAYEIINAGGHSSQIVHSTDNEDLQSLSSLLINMFKEADDDGSGSLTFDEFQLLMEQVELGISPQELRFVISEADENENGVVDYEEFVPLAVDLIQSFRARNRAKALNSQNDVMIDDQIMKSISAEELENTSQVCLEKIFDFDSKKYGLIRVQDLKRCLHAVVQSQSAQLSESEINMLCQMLPRDQFGRIKYNTTPTAFLETLSKVRFMTMKNQLIESQGSGLQKYLLDLCREEEARLEHFEGGMDKFVPTGIIPCRSLINILSNSSRLSLSRLQVLVIMSEASVLDGMINYFQFIPVVAKAIEIMFEPKALRQRAELIEKTDLSPEALLQGMSSPEMFAQRLSTLFKSYDIDHNGKLDQNEFIACLESLDFHLTYDEMVNLMNNAADIEGRGYLEFNDFVSFFRNNLLNLEREKRIRMLQTSIHNVHEISRGEATQSKFSHEGGEDPNEQSLMDRLLGIFRLSDPEHTGFISHEEFQDIMHNFSIHSSTFLSDVLLSELHLREDGNVDYMKSLTTCAELLKVFKAKESALAQHRDKEHWAEEKAMVILQASASDINHVVRYIRHKLKKLADKPTDALTRFLDIQEAIRSPQSGLSRNEANMVISKLFYGVIREGDAMALGGGPPVSSSAASIDSASFVWSKVSQAPHGGGDGSTALSSLPNIVASGGGGSSLPAGGLASGGSSSSHSSPAHHHSTSHSPSLRSSQQLRENFKSIRYQFTTEELFEAVFEARKVTIMRSLLQETDKTTTQQLIQSLLETELKQRQERGELSAETHFLPVKACFWILENCEALRLNRAQVMFIVSWAECFDRDGLALEIYKFAEHAASIIEKLHVPEAMETRANVIQQATIDDKKALNGMKEKDLVHYLENGMNKHRDERGEISSTTLREILKDLPRIKLTERDVATILAGLPTATASAEEGEGEGESGEGWEGGRQSPASPTYPSPGGGGSAPHSPGANSAHGHFAEKLCCQEILMPCVALIRSLCRERTIHRRVSLVVTSNMPENQAMSLEAKRIQEESLNQLKQLAEKLLNYVKIVMQGDAFLINLPTDTLQRRSSQLLEDGYKTEYHSVTVLYKGAKFIPVHTIRSIVTLESISKDGQLPPLSANGGRKHTSRDFSSLGNNRPLVHLETIKSTKPVFLQVLMIEDKRLYSGSTLVGNLTFMDGQSLTVDNIPVKMPSAGLVDSEAAEQFAENLVDTLFLEQPEHSDKFVLKISGY